MTRYRTIVADPPWAYDGFASDPTSGRGLPEARREKPAITPLPYPLMTVDEIKSLPVATISAADCRLFLWTTNRYLPDAFGVCAAWGFSYRQLVVWHKTGNPSPFGGSIAPNHAEYLLVAARGAPGRIDRWVTNVIAAPAQRQHSRKPDAFLDLIESASPEPRIEMFSRRARLGWDTWGNEALDHVGGALALEGEARTALAVPEQAQAPEATA